MIDISSVYRWNGEDKGFAGWEALKVSQSDQPDIFVAKGPVSGPNLFLFPGLCEPWHSFEPIFDDITKRFTVWVQDLRGHGWSDKDPMGRYGVKDYIGDACRLVDELMEGEFFVAGHSLGALIAAGVASQRPEKVRGVLLEDGPFFMTEPDQWETHPWRNRVFGDLAGRMRIAEAEGLNQEQFVDLYADRLFAFVPDGAPPQRVRWANKIFAIFADLRDSLDQPLQDKMDNAVLALINQKEATWGALFPRPMLEDFAAKYQHIDWRAPGKAASIDFSAGFDHQQALRSITCPAAIIEADRDLSGVLTDGRLDKALSCFGDETFHVLVDHAMHDVHETHPGEVSAAFERLLEVSK
ncbi:MAG: alpha/beta hydrolase [Pseudomonadota bacterium]